MKHRLQSLASSLIALVVVILLFALVDYFIHGLNESWTVPDYYFKDKVIFGFLWGIVGMILARFVHRNKAKALVFSAVIAITLQVRYFLEGYALSFVFLFLFIHFAILFVLSLGMFRILRKLNKYSFV